MIVVRNAAEIAESTSIEMLLMVSFAVERIARNHWKEFACCVGKRDRNDIREYLTCEFFLEQMFPIVIRVDGKVVLITPLFNG